MTINNKIKFKFKNTSDDKIEITLKVREHGGNVTYVNMVNELKEFIRSFPIQDGVIKEEKL